MNYPSEFPLQINSPFESHPPLLAHSFPLRINSPRSNPARPHYSRQLSTLLRHLDGFDAGKQIALIGATNRPNDLDAALISRFDVRVSFPAPDAAGRAMIFGRYAKQLTEGELRRLGHVAEGLSGRDILNVCKSAERRWVCDQLRERGDGLPYRGAGAVHAEMPLPPLRPYEEGIARYLEGMSVAVAPSPPAPGGAL